MIFQARRFPLSAAVFAIFLASSSAVFSQSPVTARLALPDAPRPQSGVAGDENAVADASVFPASDQQPQNSGQIPTPASALQQDHPMTEEERKAASEIELQKQLKQRLGGIVPNFNAVLDGSTIPLTPGQKMRAAFRSAIDPYQFGLALITSGYGQATDSHSSIDPNGNHHGYPQGWAGFGCRYGANYVDQFNGTIIGNGILPVLLHQDPRYFRMGVGSFKKRLLYSLGTTVIARGDSGKKQPNYSNVLGNLISGGISNLYYPKAEHGAALTVEQGFEVTAEGSIGALLIEFYPDIRRHFSKHKAVPKPQPAPSPAN